jgi:hypothetical protein
MEEKNLSDIVNKLHSSGLSDFECYKSMASAGVAPQGLTRQQGKDWFRKRRYKYVLWSNDKQDSVQSPTGLRDEEVIHRGDTKTVSFKSPFPMTPDEYIAKYSVDTSEWEITEFVCKIWNMGFKNSMNQGEKIDLYSVTVKQKKIAHAVETKEFLSKILEDIKGHSPDWSAAIDLPVTEGMMLELSLPDIHFGKCSFSEEAGDSYNLVIAIARFKSAINDILSQVDFNKVSTVLLPVGNDLLNFDNLSLTTTGGTPQSSDGGFYRMYRAAFDCLVWAIEQILLRASVYLVSVPGNHDSQTAWTLCQALDAWFHKAPNYQSNTSPEPRKYVQHGKVLLGFTHGDKENMASLPFIMATEESARDAWHQTYFREWHLGHLHKSASKMQMSTGDEVNGLRIRILPSLSGTDNWHFSKGYVGNIKSAEAYLWDAHRGLRQIIVHNVHKG